MASALCCAGVNCCSCLCGVCMKCCSTSHQQHTRLGFLSIQLKVIVLGMVFLYCGEDIMKVVVPIGLSFGVVFECYGDTEAGCLGVFTVYRLSFSLVVFYVIMIAGSCAGGKVSMGLNRKL